MTGIDSPVANARAKPRTKNKGEPEGSPQAVDKPLVFAGGLFLKDRSGAAAPRVEIGVQMG
ncbi:hypothetical protein, partial [Bordetella sp. 15P40C-2]|uniref:hypothetical protein n=1 Tax=Bordetella sp. 15P40C-2 TaxID=2572246 RepID=UPI001F18DAC8